MRVLGGGGWCLFLLYIRYVSDMTSERFSSFFRQKVNHCVVCRVVFRFVDKPLVNTNNTRLEFTYIHFFSQRSVTTCLWNTFRIECQNCESDAQYIKGHRPTSYWKFLIRSRVTSFIKLYSVDAASLDIKAEASGNINFEYMLQPCQTQSWLLQITVLWIFKLYILSICVP